MRYGKKVNYFGWKLVYCKVLLCNLVIVLIEYKRINIILVKVKVLRKFVELLVIKFKMDMMYLCCVVFSYF